MENDYMKKAEMVLYHTNEGDVSVNAIIRDETMWMTQKAMAMLFGVEKAAISKHLSNIYDEKELDENSTVSKMETVQNKFHFAITGKTAAEIISDTVDHTKEHMGLTTWKKSPEGRILKTDVSIAKNYLSLDEIRKLERLVSGYFDYIEDIIERQNTFTMKEFSDSVNEFINFRKYNILKDKGKISHNDAVKKANFEYDIYNKTQKINSDFDKLIEETKKKNI